MEKFKSVNPSELSEILKLHKYSPFVKEVRKRIIFTVTVFVAAMILGFVLNEQIIRILVKGLSLEGVNIVFTSPFQFINLAISCGIAAGLVVVFPIIIFQLLSFLKPALKKREYTTIMRYLPFSIVLFLIGFSFGAVIMKWQIEIFLTRSVSLGIGNILDISKLLSVVILTSVLMGIGFQFPIVLLLLMRLGVLSRKDLAKRRKWVYLGSFVFTIFLPPDSILADVFLSLPLIFLFELTLLMGRRFKK